eukprot:sb/3479571/
MSEDNLPYYNELLGSSYNEMIMSSGSSHETNNFAENLVEYPLLINENPDINSAETKLISYDVISVISDVIEPVIIDQPPDPDSKFFLTLTDDSRFDTLSSVTLAWRDLHVYCETVTPAPFYSPKSGKYSSKDILKRGHEVSKNVPHLFHCQISQQHFHSVSGYVEPGQLVAILGSSGSGKTTLLNTLAQRPMKNFKTTGTIHVNGWPIERSQMNLVSAYVEQTDNFIDVMTVRETLIFHVSSCRKSVVNMAVLRMDKRIRFDKRVAKVDAIIRKLGLLPCQHVMIGNPYTGLKGISGGQKKRLSVAVELLMDPPLMFLDEPTSGLDSYMAESMVKLISKLAQAERTILMTIHQPSSEVFALFDRVCLLADGHVAFLGDREAAIEHFDKMGKPCPNRFNPADHFIFELAVKVGEEERCLGNIECREGTEMTLNLTTTYMVRLVTMVTTTVVIFQEVVTYFKESEHYVAIEGKISQVAKDNPVRPNIISRRNMQTNYCTQLFENLKRAYVIQKRSPRLASQRWIETLIWALLSGLGFFMLPNNQEVGQNKGGLLFFFCTSFTFAYTFAQASSIPKEFPILHKEYRAGMYGVCSYLASLMILLIPHILALVMFQLIISYFLTGRGEETLGGTKTSRRKKRRPRRRRRSTSVNKGVGITKRLALVVKAH